MDRLSVAASVTGLLAAGSKLTAILTLISRLSDAPPLCKAVLTEVCDTASALRQIQTFLNGQLEVSPERREHVLLEHIATALTGCVMTKDELESLLDDLGLVYAHSGITGIFDRAKWVLKEQDIQRLVQRLQNHKTSLNLILTVFQCTSSTQIQDSVDRLCSLVEEAVSNSSALSIRLSRLEGNSTVCHPNNETSARPDVEEIEMDSESVRTITRAPENLFQLNESQVLDVSFAFDPELRDSRVYRKLLLLGSDGHSETSVTSSARQRAAASIFSAVSLAEISNLSQYSLPIFFQEIANNGWYVHVARISTSGGMHVSPPKIIIDVKDLAGKRKSYEVKPTDTSRQLKEMIWYPPTDQTVLVYSGPGGKFLKLQDDKSFAEQGITSTNSQARIVLVLRYRAGRTEVEAEAEVQT